MLPDDPRHGSYAGAVQHWLAREPTCEPCRDAGTRDRKRRRLHQHRTGQGVLVPTWRALRRIQALRALGWTQQAIAAAGGVSTGTINSIGRSPSVEPGTFQTVQRAYRALAMKPPPTGRYAQRNRNYALRQGWPPPLAWDRIDDPDEAPSGWHYLAPSRADALRDLDARKAGISEACRLLQIRQEALAKWCDRHGMRALYLRLVGRETPPVEYRNQWTREVS